MKTFVVDLGDLRLGRPADLLKEILRHVAEQGDKEDKDNIDGVPREFWDKVAGEARTFSAEGPQARSNIIHFFATCPNVAATVVARTQEMALQRLDENLNSAAAWLVEYDKRMAAAKTGGDGVGNKAPVPSGDGMSGKPE